MCNVKWNATLNADGSVTVYATINNRTESETLFPGETTYTPPTTRKKSAKKTTAGDVPNESLPKTKRRYLAPNGKMVSYARARQLKLV